MHVPSGLDEWTFETVSSLAGLGQCEGDRHDFKYDLPDPDNLTKVCCAFANSSGGFIVVGVKDRSGHFLVEGTNPNGEVAKRFADKLDATPSIEFLPPRVIDIPSTGKVLYVFHVPRSPRRPHLPRAPDKRTFWKRTPGGCEQMTFDEIQEQFLRQEERRDKLKLLFVELLLNRENLADIVAVNGSDGTYSLITLDTQVLDRLLVDTCSVIQGDTELVRILITLRTQLNVINAKTRIFFGQMTMPRSDAKDLAAVQHSFMEDKAKALIPAFEQALKILQTRYHLKNPLEHAPA